MRRRIDQPLCVRVLGGLSTLAAVAALFSACDGDKKQEPAATSQRSQAVTATGGAGTTPAPPASSAALPKPKKPPRKLCAGELDRPGKKLTDKPVSRASAPGARAVPDKLAPSAQSWTWVNFWAAWCVPCKEEMPRLIEFEKKLGGKLRLVFVSLDDDQRQLDDFLKTQPESGVRASYWLKEGKEREDWLKAAEVEDDPELPTHLLVDSAGKIRCRVKGAVEDSDFPSIAQIVGS